MERIWPRGFQTVCLREQMRERSRRAPCERCGTGKNAEVLFSARGGARCLQRTGDAAWRQTDRARALCAVRDVCLAGRDLCARAARRRVHVCTVRRSHLIKVGHTHASPSRPTPPTIQRNHPCRSEYQSQRFGPGLSPARFIHDASPAVRLLEALSSCLVHYARATNRD